jgi:hypothetical protein
MAGTAKHYVFNDGRNRYVDHRIITVMLTHIKGLYSNSGIRENRDKGTAIINALTSVKGSWRGQLLAAWKELKPLVGVSMCLTEYRVRPNRSAKACGFRQVARDYRSWKPKAMKKFSIAYTPVPAGTPLTGNWILTNEAPRIVEDVPRPRTDAPIRARRPVDPRALEGAAHDARRLHLQEQLRNMLRTEDR